MNIPVQSFRPDSLRSLSVLKKKVSAVKEQKPLSSSSSTEPPSAPKKLAVFDIDNTLMYYHYLNNHPNGKTNFEPINPVLDIEYRRRFSKEFSKRLARRLWKIYSLKVFLY